MTLLKELDDLKQDPRYTQAVENVRDDLHSAQNPHGNLGRNLVSALEAACQAGTEVEDAIKEHLSTERPDLHRECQASTQVRRVMSRSDFVDYHVLRGATDQSERDPWIQLLTPGEYLFDGGDLNGSTGRPDGLAWWAVEESGRPAPNDGRRYVAELALGEGQRLKAQSDGAVVEVTLDADLASDRYFKPTALEGFGPNTPFRPELGGAAHGRTAPDDPRLQGWPEAVSESGSYVHILDEDDEIGVRVLTY